MNNTIEEYRKMMYVYGVGTLYELLESNERREDYVECQKIKDAIDSHNERVNDNLKTRK